MDKDTRNSIERATQRARKLLEEDFAAQLEGTFDVLRTGTVAATAGPHLSARQNFQREKIVASLDHKRAAGMTAAEAISDYLRDAAFTTLNRFVALKMLEARELVQECITKGEDSGGYREFCGMAAGVALLPESAGYRLFLESLFDELSTEVKVLFDRRDVASVLWPKRVTFDAVLDVLNSTDLAGAWSEDETIGWVYQFFNGGDERRAMREASQAPRNSRELAVRNQFFTPRYVVQFLTDNTLARIWYEMRGGDTGLAKSCQYLVTRPEAPSAPRRKKDPRDLRVLDPACGSGHFLLYAFDLLIAIYEEAYRGTEGPKSEATGQTLTADYPSLDALKRALPALVLAHNLHGVDIDPRCAQIAQLALWMRAQRAFREFGVDRVERPLIRRSNIVVAEPLVTDDAMLKEFLAKLDGAELGRVFTALVETLKLAGDLGLLLRVETLLSRGPKRGQVGDLFAPPEARIRTALASFVATSSALASTTRRLFADDAAQGVGLLETAEKKFDVVLMNPPFGYVPDAAGTYLETNYPNEKNDVYAAFVARALELLNEDGLAGQLTSSTCFSLSHLAQFRSRRLLGDSSRVSMVADLGFGVLDDAAVNTAAYIVSARGVTDECVFVDLRRSDDKALHLRRVAQGEATVRVIPLDVFRSLPGQPLAYTLLTPVTQLLTAGATLGGSGADVNVGMMTGDDFRFLRTWWECGSREPDAWRDYEKGNGFARFLADPVVCVRAKDDFAEVSADVAAKYGSASRFIMNRVRYGQPGLVYTRITVKGFSVRFLPPGQIFSGAGLAIFPDAKDSTSALCAFLNSRVVEHSLTAFTDGRKWEAGYVRNAPLPASVVGNAELGDLSLAAAAITLSLLAFDETTRFFVGVPGPEQAIENHRQLTAQLREILGRIDEASFCLVSTGEEDRAAMDAEIGTREDWLAREEVLPADMHWEDRQLSYFLGCAFGRWKPASERAERPLLSDVLTNGIPTLPVRFNADIGRVRSILVDDPGNDADAAACVALVGASHGSDRSEEGYRLWLRSKAFEQHLSLYSGCRRRAPIYWQLSTPSVSYSVWLYLHGFTKDTLYNVQNDYVAPKLAHEERRLESLRRELGENPTAAERKPLVAQETFVAELRAFLDEVKRVAPIWNPNLDDGVVVNFAPLWRLVPHHKPWQKDLKTTWDALCAGDHDWGHLAMNLWPERVVPKCATSRSIAIAHGLESEFWVEGSDGKWKTRATPLKPVDELVGERSSTAVKAALKNLLDAPTSGAGNRKRKGMHA